MTRNEIIDAYFNWMYKLVCDGKYSKRRSYRKLFKHLHSRYFTYTIELDGNREADGIDLRYQFAYEHNYDRRMIAAYLDDKQCSILEMLVALSLRCEEHIMDNPELGNRIGKWFWSMMDNLGLGDMSDSRFDDAYTDKILDRFLNREYKRNGEGGLFTVEPCAHDLRTVEIWYQMCWYLLDYI